MLIDSGVEVQQVKTQLVVDGRVYPPGSFVVSMAQPKQGLVRWMLGRTFYPDNTYTRDPDGNADSSVRHVHRHVRRVHGRAERSDRREGDRRPHEADGEAAPAGTVAAAAPNGYVLDGRLNDSFRAAFLLLDKGVGVRRASQPSADGSVKAGDFLVAAGDHAAIAKQTGVDFVARSRRTTGAYALHKPRVACTALQRRQHGRGLDAPDVRAVQPAVQVDHGRRDQGRQPRTPSTTRSSCLLTRRSR